MIILLIHQDLKDNPISENKELFKKMSIEISIGNLLNASYFIILPYLWDIFKSHKKNLITHPTHI